MGRPTDMNIMVGPGPGPGGDYAKTIAYMAFNFFSCIAIVFCNKWLFQNYHFDYATLVTCLHSLATWMGVMVNHLMGQYKVKQLSHWDVFPITFSFCSYVVFNNLSLQYNSIGMYQMMKILTTPVSVVLQDVWCGVHMPWKLKLSLLPVCLGVAMATVSDMSFNITGAFWATAGLLATAFYQLLLKTKQDKLQVGSFQLLHYQAPQSTLLVAMCTPLFDQVLGKDGFLQYNYTPSAIWAITASSILAYLVNLSTFLLIGHTSPVSYQVLGHFKVLVILTAGIAFFHEDTNMIRLLGMALAFNGIVSYTILNNMMSSSGWSSNSSKGSQEGQLLEEKKSRLPQQAGGEETGEVLTPLTTVGDPEEEA